MWWPNNTPGGPRFPRNVQGHQRMQIPQRQVNPLLPQQNPQRYQSPLGFNSFQGVPPRVPMPFGAWQQHGSCGPRFNPGMSQGVPVHQFSPVVSQPLRSPVATPSFRPSHPHPQTVLPGAVFRPQSPWPQTPSSYGLSPRPPLAYHLAAEPSIATAFDRYTAQQSTTLQPTPQIPPHPTVTARPKTPNLNQMGDMLSRYGVRPLPDVSQQLKDIITGQKQPIAKASVDAGQRTGIFPSPDPFGGRGVASSAGFHQHWSAPGMTHPQLGPFKFGAAVPDSRNWKYHGGSERKHTFNASRRVVHERGKLATPQSKGRGFNSLSRDSDADTSESPRPRRHCFSPPLPEIRRAITCKPSEEFYTEPNTEQMTLSTIVGKSELAELYRTFEDRALNMMPLEIEEEEKEDAESSMRSQITASGDGEKDEYENSDTESMAFSEKSAGSGKSRGSDFNVNTFGDSDDDDDGDSDVDSSSGEADSDGMNESSSDEEENLDRGPTPGEVHKRKLADPDRIHPELWFNEKGQTNYGPVCRCSAQDRKKGIQHAVYPGETDVPLCESLGNNSHTLHHYWVTITPHANFMTERPTVIKSSDKEYTFEGFSLLSHQPLDKVPLCSLIRFNIEYNIHLVEEPVPKNFCVQGIDLFAKFLFHKVLELFDWELKDEDKDVCQRYHFMPRFIHRHKDAVEGEVEHELLCMDKVLSHVINSAHPLVQPCHSDMPKGAWHEYVDSCKNSIVMRPDKKPAAFRVDDVRFIDEDHDTSSSKKVYPVVVHNGVRPVQQSFAGNAKYQSMWKSFVNLRKLIANKPVPSRKDQDKLVELKIELEKMRLKSSMRRDVLVELSARGLIKTGLNSDICQAAMLLPVLVHHARYHACLHSLDKKLGYTFEDRSLLQLALTHPSYHLNFGVNPDQARNSLSNCGIKQPRYGDRRVRHMHTRKRGITQLIRVMSNLGKMEEHQSMIRHNERLEFLGDAVLEFISSVHLYFMLSEQPEGGLAMFRSALVQNKHLAKLAKKIDLLDYMQYAHGPDLCAQEDVNHAMANCLEAILGSMYLEAGIKTVTDFFGRLAFDEEELVKVWSNLPKHPLQLHQPSGDRHLISSSPLLQNLVKLEEAMGVEFTHIRVLARAFTHPQVGFNNLTLGTNQRLEFLGDSILQFVVSVFLYKHFPEHHEGHLTLLRSSLVNRRIQSTVCRELGLDKYINFGSTNMKKTRPKLLADILEAFVAALYVDKGLQHVEAFCRVCLFPRLEEFIINQDWMDAKSQLQQCILTLREQGKSPELPVYKVLQDKGPAHHKEYKVGVYYKGKRLAKGDGPSIQQAEMTAAKTALSSKYFPELSRQKHLLDRKHRDRRRNYCNRAPRNKEEEELHEEEREPQWVEETEEGEETNVQESEEDEEEMGSEPKRLKQDTALCSDDR